MKERKETVMSHILIVDDTAFVRARCLQLLSGIGYDILEAATLEEGIAQYMRYGPGLVLMDVTIPGVDGIVAMQRIMDLDPEARVVMLAALGHQPLVMQAIQAGARDYVTKPFRPEQLLVTVQKHVRHMVAT